LISTSTIPGVYNPPYSKKAMAFGQDVESHLKTIFREQYQTGKFRKKRNLPLPATLGRERPTATIQRLTRAS